MDAARWRRLDALFLQALEEPPDERLDFLRRACGDDPTLVDEVAAMLAADDGAQLADPAEANGDDRLADIVRSGFDHLAQDKTLTPATGSSEAPRANQPSRPSTAPLPFPSLGVYRLTEELGRGGLATVYAAERDDAQFTMRVAIKLVRRGFDTPELLERLRLERQILARLEHPNIARLIDGGTAPDGRPYFVMEHIEGERIDRWCERQKLDLRQRLELFRTLCDAVHAAHGRLVLHRDIKPSNILVTHSGVPKLLDFGIAKILAAGDEDALVSGFSTLTGTGMQLLTPEFASPEQVRGKTLTTASDVYSLGVLLYHLVAGAPPYVLDRQRPAEIERVVCEIEPLRASAVVGDDAANNATPTRRQILGWPRRAGGDDLDTILLKALRKEPERRYGSASRLADDLHNYLEDLPVSARPDTLRYRSGKFLRRHRMPVLTAVTLVLILVTAVVVTSWQARVARRAQQVAEEQRTVAETQRNAAQRERRRAEEAANFLTDIFEVSDPYRTVGERITAREVLDRGASRLRDGLEDDPLLRATLLTTIAKVYQNLSLFDDSEALFTEALSLRRQHLGESAPEVVSSERHLANLWLDQERFQEASDALEQVVLARRRLDDPTALATVLYDAAVAQRGLGHGAAADNLLAEALDLQEEAGDTLAVTQIRNLLGKLRRGEGQYEAAEQILREVLATRRQLLQKDHPLITQTLNDLAITMQQNGQLEAAETLYREILETQQRVFGERHHHVVTALHNLAGVLVDRNRVAAAMPLYDRSEALVSELYGEDHPAMGRLLYSRAKAHRVARQLDLAIPLARRAWQIHADHFGPDHRETLRAASQLAAVLLEQGSGEAEAALLDLVADLRRVLAGDFRLSYPLYSLAKLRLQRGDAAAAEPIFREALELRRATLSATHWQTAQTQGQLGRCLVQLQRFDEADDLLRGSHQTLLQLFGATHPQTEAVAGYLRDLEAQR